MFYLGKLLSVFHGRLMPARKQIICFDLDGTIIPFNSFKYFIPFCLIWLISTLQFSEFSNVLRIGIRKGLGKVEHLLFKQAVCNASHRMGKLQSRLFARFCLRFKRKSVSQRIQSFKDDGVQLVLCTAAPDIYARQIASILGFQECLAFGTPGIPGSEGIDNIRGEKLRRFLLYYDTLDEMFGDHSDDLEMLTFAKRATIVHPNKIQKEKILAVLNSPYILE